MINDYMTPAEAAVELKRTVQMIYNYFKSGKLTKVVKMVDGEERTFVLKKQVDQLKEKMYPAKG